MSTDRRITLADGMAFSRLCFLIFVVTISSCTAVNYDRKEERGQFRGALAAAKRGDPMAQYIVAEMYGKGDGTRKDCSEALVWMRRSADGGEAQAQLTLGSLYCQGYCGRRDLDAGLSLIRRSGVTGDARIRKAVASTFLRGMCTEPSRSEAWAWLIVAGDAEAKEAARALLARMTAKEQLEAERLLDSLRTRIKEVQKDCPPQEPNPTGFRSEEPREGDR